MVYPGLVPGSVIAICMLRQMPVYCRTVQYDTGQVVLFVPDVAGLEQLKVVGILETGVFDDALAVAAISRYECYVSEVVHVVY